MIFCTCPLCGANLDPGERCDCAAEEKKANLPPRFDTDGQATGKEEANGKAKIREAENGYV